MKVQIIKWCIPYFGNKHSIPYGVLRVTEGERTQVCPTKGDKIGAYNPVIGQYITFNRKRYKVVNNGGIYTPKIELKPIEI